MCTKIHTAGQKQNPRHGRLAESTPLYCKSTINDAFGGGGDGNNKCFDVIDGGIKGMWDAHIIRRVSIGTEGFHRHGGFLSSPTTTQSALLIEPP
jgi:hypothetical protein